MADNLLVGIILKAIDRATAPIRRVTKNFELMRAASVRANKSFAKAANIRQAAEGMSRFARAARGAVLAPIKEFESFQAAMSAVKAKTKNLTDQEFTDLTNKAKELGAATRFTSTQSATAMEFMAQAGFNAAEQLEAVPTVLNLATAAGTDLGRTSDILTDIMGAFGKTTADTTNVADILTTTMIGSNTTLETLFETLKIVGPPARLLGIELKDVAVMAGILGNAGIKGSLGATALKASLTRLIKPIGGAKKILRDLKIEVADADGKFRGLSTILQDVDEKTKALGQVERARKISELFGIRGVTGAANIISSLETGKLVEFTKEMENIGGATNRVATIMDDNAAGATIRLTSALSGLGVEVGEKMEPALTSLKETVTAVIQSITAWVVEHPGLTKAIGLTAGAVALLATGLTGIIFTLVAATTALGVFQLATGGAQTGQQLMASSLKFLGGRIKAFASLIFTRTIPAVFAWVGSIATTAMPTFTAWAIMIWTKTITAITGFAVAIWTRAIPAMIAWIVKLWASVPAAAAAALPFLAVALAIGAITLAIIQLIKHWDELDFAEVMKGISQTVGESGVFSTILQSLDPRTLLEDMGLIGEGELGGTRAGNFQSQDIGALGTQGQQGFQLGEGKLKIEIVNGKARPVDAVAPKGLMMETDFGELELGG